MKSETIAIQQVFQDRRQYRVPFYQRAYVWNRDEQWETSRENARRDREAVTRGARLFEIRICELPHTAVRQSTLKPPYPTTRGRRPWTRF